MGALPFVLSCQVVSSRSAVAQGRGSGNPQRPPIVLIRDAETESLLHSFADPLYRSAGLDPRLIRITLVRDRALNAFVTTGNRMFIHTGLIQQANSALEVIGPIAHETGHVAHGDISRLPEMAYQAMIQSLGSLLIGAAAGAASRNPGVAVGTALGGASMAERQFMSFSRAQEESADQSALGYLDRLGWSAAGMMTMFSRLEQEEALVVNRRDPYLLTHPMTRDRFNFVQRHVQAKSNIAVGTTTAFEAPFQMVKAKLNAFIDNPAVVARNYPQSDTSAPGRYARAVLDHRMGHRDSAVRLLDSLLAEQPTNPWLNELKGQVLFEGGQPKAAIAPYMQAVRYAPDQPLIRQSLGHALIESGDPANLRQAITQLQFAQRQTRDDDRTWHLLGIAWGRLGNIGEANLALAEEAMLVGDIPTARRFARQAADVLPSGPSKLRALDISNAVKKENRL